MPETANPTATSELVWDSAAARSYRRRWRIWFVVVLSHSIGLFHRAAMNPMADRIMADFDLTAVAFGSLGAVYFYIYAAMQLPSGTLADTLGPRKTITLGLLLTTAGTLIMGTAPSFSFLYAGRVVVSFGASIVWLSVVKIIMNWFRSREVSTVTGLAGAINNTGQLLAATPLALLIMAIGWRMSFVAAAGVSLTVAVFTWFTVKDSPVDAGLKSLSEFEGESTPSERAAPKLSVWQRLIRVLKDRNLWPLFLVALGTYGSYTTFFLNWLVIYLMQTYNVTRDYAATFALVSAVGAIIGTSALGFISDRIRSRRIPITFATFVTLVCYVTITFWNSASPPLEAFWPLSFLIGFMVGAMPVCFGAVRDIAEPELRGMSSGIVNMGGFVGAAIVQPLFGYILDRGWQGELVGDIRHYPPEAYQKALLLCCLLVTLGFLGAILMRTTRSRRATGSAHGGSSAS